MRIWLLSVFTSGCVAVEPSGQPFRPVVIEAEEPEAEAIAETEPPPPAPADVAEPPDGYDFDGEAREAPTDPALSSIAGPLAAEPEVETGGPGEREAEPEPVAPVPVWDPSKPLADVSFGVRVVATLLDLQPPRAVLGLPDGSEEVVRPGTMLPEHGLVVLAIGRDAVQLARITPEGFHASVQTDTIRALYPERPSAD